MKKMFTIMLAIVFLSACKKEKITHTQPVTPDPHPVMQYLDLHDEGIAFGQHKKIDLNSDGKDDLLFSTILVGDPVLERDRRQYYVSSGTESRLLQNQDDQSPILNRNDQVSLQHPGYEWFEVVSVLLAEKIIPQNGAPFLQGSWKDADHKFLPVQVKKNGNIFNGWIELSFDKQLERIVLHRAALCTEAGKTVRAGI